MKQIEGMSKVCHVIKLRPRSISVLPKETNTFEAAFIVLRITVNYSL